MKYPLNGLVMVFGLYLSFWPHSLGNYAAHRTPRRPRKERESVLTLDSWMNGECVAKCLSIFVQFRVIYSSACVLCELATHMRRTEQMMVLLWFRRDCYYCVKRTILPFIILLNHRAKARININLMARAANKRPLSLPLPTPNDYPIII